MIGISAAEMLLQKLDAKRFDLVDVTRAGKPPVHLADMAFGRAGADLGGEKRTHGWARRGLRCEKIDAFLAAPGGVSRHGFLHLLPHFAGVGAGLDKGTRGRKRVGIMDFKTVRAFGAVHRALLARSPVILRRYRE